MTSFICRDEHRSRIAVEEAEGDATAALHASALLSRRAVQREETLRELRAHFADLSGYLTDLSASRSAALQENADLQGRIGVLEREREEWERARRDCEEKREEAERQAQEWRLRTEAAVREGEVLRAAVVQTERGASDDSLVQEREAEVPPESNPSYIRASMRAAALSLAAEEVGERAALCAEEAEERGTVAGSRPPPPRSPLTRPTATLLARDAVPPDATPDSRALLAMAQEAAAITASWVSRPAGTKLEYWRSRYC